MAGDLVERARRLADEVLFPAALRVDLSGQIPAEHLDTLAAGGFYGLDGPAADGGVDVDLAEAAAIIETLAGGCLATTFVWLQHLGSIRAVTATANTDLRAQWLAPLCRGERRAGVVQAALRPGPPLVRAEQVPGGYRFTGAAPWVTGWGLVDVLHTAARDEQDQVIWALLDAAAGPTLTVEPLDLVAVNASRTVTVHFADHFVPADRVTAVSRWTGSQSTAPEPLRINGSLALGVAGRCARLADDPELAAEVDAARQLLDAGSAESMPAARAAGSALAMRAATRLAVVTGARSVLRDQHAQRLLREAAFLLVFGSRPSIRAALLTLV